MLAKLRVTSHPDTPFLVEYTDPTRRERSGRSKRIQKWFKDRGEADDYRDDLNKRLQLVGTTGLVFDNTLRADALAARQELDGAGFETLSLLEMARDHVRRSPLRRAVQKDAREALQEFLERKRYEENRSEETTDDLEKRLTKWFELCDITSVAQITREAVLALRARRKPDRTPLSARARKNDLSAAHGFCEYLVAEKFLTINPVAGVEWPVLPKKRPVAWDPQEAEAFLRAAESYRSGALVAAVVARLFAGIRPSEMTDSRAVLDVAAPCIRAEGGKLRGRANRTVPLAENVVEWLRRYPPEEGGAFPYISARAWQELRLAAVKRLKGRPLKWVADIARHTFISYRLVMEPDEAVVAREAGNSPDEIYASYHHLKMPAQATVFWGLRPTPAT